MNRLVCVGVGVVVLAGCAGSPSAPDRADTPAAEAPAESAAKVSPFVGTWENDRLTTWLAVWEAVFGQPKSDDIPADQYDEMAAKIDEIVDSMSVVVELGEDGSVSIESAMMGQTGTAAGTWAKAEDGKISLTTQSAQTGESSATGALEGGKLVLTTEGVAGSLGQMKFNRVRK
ncbi:MAG: hypothetical protein ACIARQ_15555 [Phycisphaerales bacterium JB061]